MVHGEEIPRTKECCGFAIYNFHYYYREYAKSLVKHKKYAIAIPLLLTMVLFPGVIVSIVPQISEYTYKTERFDITYITPVNAITIGACDDVNKFPQELARSVNVIFDARKTDMTLTDQLRDSWNVHEHLLAFEYKYDGETYTYADICYQPCTEGRVAGSMTPFAAFDSIEELDTLTEAEVITRLQEYFNEEELEMLFSEFSDLTTNEQIWLKYTFQRNGDESTYNYEHALVEEFESYSETDAYVFVFTPASLDKSIVQLSVWTFFNVGIAFTGLVFFLGVAVCGSYSEVDGFRIDWKLLLILVSNVSIVVFSSAGLYGYFLRIDVAFCVGIGVALGVVVDDMLVILNHFRHDQEGTPEERMIRALTACSESISFTTSTSIMAFASSALIPIEMYKYASIVICITLAFSYLYTVTYFCALLSMEAEKRCDEDYQGRMTVITKASDGNFGAQCRKSKFSVMPKTKFILEEEEKVNLKVQDDDEEEDSVEAHINAEMDNEEEKNIVRANKSMLGDMTDEKEMALISSSACEKLSNCLKSKVVCAFLILLSLFLFWLGIDAFIHGEKEAGVEPFFRASTPWIVFQRQIYEFGEKPGYQDLVEYVDRDTDYSDPNVQAALSDFKHTMQETGNFYNASKWWYSDYENYENKTYTAENIMYFMTNVETQYQNDFLTDNDGNLVSTRGFFQFKRNIIEEYVWDWEEDAHELYHSLHEGDINAKIFSIPLTAMSEIDIAVSAVLVNIVISALICVGIMSLIFLPFLQGIFLMFSVIMIDINILGITRLFGICIGPISLLCVLAGFGFAVDYNIHALHGWFSSGAHDRDYDGKLKFLMEVIASASLNASMSTIVVFMFMYITGYVFLRNVATGFICIIVLSVLYACIIIPCCLYNFFSFFYPYEGPKGDAVPNET